MGELNQRWTTNPNQANSPNTGTGGGSTPSNTSTPPAEPVKVVTTTDDYGNIKIVSGGESIRTIGQIRTEAEYKAGTSFSGTTGTSATEKTDAGTITVENLGEGIQGVTTTTQPKPKISPRETTGQSTQYDTGYSVKKARTFQEIRAQPYGAATRQDIEKLFTKPAPAPSMTGTVTEAPKRTFLNRSGVADVGRDFIAGLSFGSAYQDERFTFGERLRSGQVNPVAGTAGLVAGIATFGKGKEAAQATTQTFKGGAKLLQQATPTFFKTTRTGRFISGVVKVEAGLAGVNLGYDVYRDISTPSQEKFLTAQPQFKEALSTSYEKLGKEQNTFFRGVLYNIGTFAASNKGVFTESIREEGKRAGLQGEALNTFVEAGKREFKTRAAQEVTSLVVLSAGTEYIGQRMFSVGLAKKAGAMSVKKTTGVLAREAARNLPALGAYEGARQEITQQQIRQDRRGLFNFQDKKTYEILGKEIKLNRAQEAGLMGGAGAATATALGLPIAAFSVAKPGTSKSLLGLAYLTDAYEFVGDKLAGAGDKALKFIGVSVATPSVTLIEKPEAVLSVSSKRKGSVLFGGGGAPIPSVTRTPTASAYIPTPSTASTFVNTITGTPTPTDTTTPTSIGTTTPTNIFTPTNINVPTNININTATNTPTNIATVINIPVATPMPRFPPPLPLVLPFSGGAGVGSRKGKKTKFIDELEVGRKLFNALTGYNVPGRKKPKRRKK